MEFTPFRVSQALRPPEATRTRFFVVDKIRKKIYLVNVDFSYTVITFVNGGGANEWRAHPADTTCNGSYPG